MELRAQFGRVRPSGPPAAIGKAPLQKHIDGICQACIVPTPHSFVPGTTAGKPKAGAHKKGDVFMDSKAAIFVCVKSGTPGSWVELTAKKL
jgi:hypothetical protein